MQKKLNLIKMLLCYFFVILFFSCSNATMIGSSIEDIETSIKNNDTMKSTEAQVEFIFPNVGRGWDIEKYTITASRPNQDDIVKETKDGKLKLTLKIGTWKFVASAVDKYDNVLYSAAKSVTIKEGKNTIKLELIQRIANAIVKMTCDDNLTEMKQFKVKATRGQEFDDIIEIVDAIDNWVVLQSLAVGEWHISATAIAKDGLQSYFGEKTFVVDSSNISQTKDVDIELIATRCPKPVFSVSSGKVVAGTQLQMSSTMTDAKVYYTIDGTEPDPINDNFEASGKNLSYTINKDVTIKAVVYKNGVSASEVVSNTYTIVADDEVADPQISPVGCTITETTFVTISCGTNGATIYYTTDGSTPSTSSSVYSSQISVNKTCTIKAIAVKNTKQSNVVSQTYTYKKQVCGNPTITASGTYPTGTKISIISSTTGSTTYYTIDGSEPTTLSQHFESSIELDTSDWNNGTYIIKAKSVASGKDDSEVVTSTIVIKQNDNDDDNVTFKLLDNLIVASESDKLYTDVGTMAANTCVWYGFVRDIASTIYIETIPSENITITLYKDGQNENAKLTLSATDNSTTIESGEHYYYVKLFASKQTSNVKVRVYASEPIVTKKLTGVTISPNATSVTGSQTLRFTAMASYSNSSNEDVTTKATWISSKTSVATISSGIVTLVSAGTTDISCSFTDDGITKNSATTTVTVSSSGSGTIDKLYLIPGLWEDVGNSRYAAYFFTNTTNKWVDMTLENGKYVCERQDGFDMVILCRMNSATTTNEWKNKYDQTENLTLPIDKDTYEITGWGDSYGANSKGQWLSTLSGTYGSGTLSATVGSSSTTTSTTTTLPPTPPTGLRIYIKADSAPTIWAWETNEGTALSSDLGEKWESQPKMVAATDMNDPTGWYVKDFSSLTLKGTGSIVFILNKDNNNRDSGMRQTFWYDGTSYYTADPTVPPDPVKPVITLSPSNGSTVRTTGSISVTFTNGYDIISAATVTINGTSYNMGTTATTFTKSLAELGITTDGVSISVNASVTNGQGTTTASASYTSRYVDPSKEDFFTWDNVNAYFVLTDRFYNGDTKNDHSYYRQNGLSGDSNVATFHGGDLSGLTAKMDYLSNLGVNAIWITAVYEQAHGWCSGGGVGFPHYAFHGYYTQDWTYMDQNIGTIEEFRTFVNKCHENGIRVIMDVVMNHTGYNTVEDMITYNFGNFKTIPTHGWMGSGSWKDNHDITNYSEQGNWGNWWGPWVRAFDDQPWYTNAGYERNGSGDVYKSLSGLPDVVTEKTTSVAIPAFLKTKWALETDNTTVSSATGNTTGNKYGDYKLPSISNVDWNGKTGDWRTRDNLGAPSDYQVMWLSAWVREFGIDGFRCDTAKHVDMFRWGQLKVACQSALEAWRNDSSKTDNSGAKDWDESFWMTGEHFGWGAQISGDYFTTGKFDSMINFSFNGSPTGSDTTRYPDASTWTSYSNMINQNPTDSDNNGNRNNVLTYLSSHDTSLCRPSDTFAQGTMFILTPGGIQIYYGDESSRPRAYTGCGDTDMMTRGDMNWSDVTGTKAAQVAHWGKVGTFRKYNPAVGAGTGSATKRTYNGPAGENKVAISVSGTTVDVSGLFANGTTVYNWYDGTSATVNGGSVTFAGGTTSQPILVSERDPSVYGIVF